MTRRLLGILFIAAVALAVASPAAANCLPAKLAGNTGYAVGGGGYIYVQVPGSDVANQFVARFWQTNDITRNEGTYNAATQIFPANPAYYGPDTWAFLFDLGNPGTTAGCPTSCLTIYIEDEHNDRAFLWTANEGGKNNSLNFDFTSFGPGIDQGAPSPRPRATLSSRAGNIVNVNYNIPDFSAAIKGETTPCGTDGTVVTARVFRQQAATRPSHLVTGGWVQDGGDLPATGGARVNALDCTNTASDWWVAVGLIVNGAAPRFVGEPMRVECDPNLADPGQGFKLIERPAPKKPVKDQ